MHPSLTILEITTTYPDRTTAEQITNKLIKEKLIACGNIHPCQSIYLWNDALVNEEEVIAHYKSSLHLAQNIEARIIELHPYQVPAILMHEITANPSYVTWVKSCVAASSTHF